MKRQSVRQKQLGYNAIRAAVRTSRSLSEAARTLGVNRSTLHRWIAADPSLTRPIREREEAAQEVTAAAGEMNPAEWIAWVERTYDPTPPERILLGLARRALEIAHDESVRPSERVSAMGRFQQLLKQLDLEEPNNAPQAKPALYAVK